MSAVPEASSDLPRVSVIVPAYNEERYLGATLRAVANLDYPRDRVEVIVVDNGSSDGTVAIAHEAGALVLVEPFVTVAALRNSGRARASGDVLAFLDADCIPACDWLRRAAASLAERSAVTGARVAVPDAATWVGRSWFAQPSQGRVRVPYINSGNLIVQRAIFDAVDGFDSRLRTGEDPDFCRRAAAVTEVIADNRIRVTHEGYPKTAKEFLRREIWHGMGTISRSGMTFRNLPLVGAVVFAGLLMLLAFGLVAWAAGRGSSYLAVGAAAALTVMLVLSAAYRLGTSSRPWRLVQVSFLYFLYYLGRALAIPAAFVRGLLSWGGAARAHRRWR